MLGILAALSRHWALRPGHRLLRIRLPPSPASFHHGKSSGEGEEGRKFQEVLTAKEHWGTWEWE